MDETPANDLREGIPCLIVDELPEEFFPQNWSWYDIDFFIQLADMAKNKGFIAFMFSYDGKTYYSNGIQVPEKYINTNVIPIMHVTHTMAKDFSVAKMLAEDLWGRLEKNISDYREGK